MTDYSFLPSPAMMLVIYPDGMYSDDNLRNVRPSEYCCFLQFLFDLSHILSLMVNCIYTIISSLDYIIHSCTFVIMFLNDFVQEWSSGYSKVSVE